MVQQYKKHTAETHPNTPSGNLHREMIEFERTILVDFIIQHEIIKKFNQLKNSTGTATAHQ
jgi:hypothetical protein